MTGAAFGPVGGVAHFEALAVRVRGGQGDGQKAAAEGAKVFIIILPFISGS